MTNPPGEGTTNWVRTLEGDDRAYALGLLGMRVAEEDPETAAALQEEARASGKAPLGEPTSKIADLFARQDPRATAAWANGFQDWWMKQPAVAGVSAAWAREDPVALSRWIQKLTPGPARNNAINNLVKNVAPADPGSALRWAADVTDHTEKRMGLMQQVVDQWSRFAPEEARSGLEQLSLSESDRRQLLGRINYDP
ncbi:MAG: hypothetical protein AAF514_15905 [Verrucomicrobiota bacterium]